MMQRVLLTFLTVLAVTVGSDWVEIVKHQQKTLNACLDKITSPTSRKMVIFAATSSKDLKDLSKDARVIYDTVSLNVGNGYNKKDGIFTAPEAGFYKFEWTHTTHPKYYFITGLVKNGVVQAYNHPGSQADYETGTQSIIFHMNVGDRVWLQARGTYGQFMAKGMYSTFNGFML